MHNNARARAPPILGIKWTRNYISSCIKNDVVIIMKRCKFKEDFSYACLILSVFGGVLFIYLYGGNLVFSLFFTF